MEHCPTCNLQKKRNNKYSHELTNIHLAASKQYYCQQCKKTLNLADKRSHLQSNEHKNSKRMCYCEACKTDIKKILKLFTSNLQHIKKMKFFLE